MPVTIHSIAWDRWRPTDRATLLFVVQDDDVLLIRKKRGLGAGKINAPGGRIQPGENPVDAAVREVQEELVVTPHDPILGGHLSFQFVDGYSIYVHVFTSSSCTGHATETDEAIPLWTPIDCIPYHEMWADDRIWVPLLLDGVPFDGRFVFAGDRMLDHSIEVGDGVRAESDV